MHPSLLNLLCCPYDKSFPLQLETRRPAPAQQIAGTRVPSNQAMTVSDGALICPCCRRRFPIRNGIPHLLPDELAVDRTTPPSDEAGRIKWLQQRQRNAEAEKSVLITNLPVVLPAPIIYLPSLFVD